MIVKYAQIWYYMAMSSVVGKFYDIFEEIEREADELNQLISAVEIMSDHKLYNHYLKKLKKIEKIANKYKQYKKIESDLLALEELKALDQDDQIDLEVSDLKTKQALLFEELKSDYAQGFKLSEEMALVEIDSKEDIEFVKQIQDMIIEYAKDQDFLTEIDAEKNASIKLKGEGVFEKLNIFSGKVKKVERGAESFATIVVLKSEKQGIEIREEDLEIQTSRSGGAGGQHINKTESAVKIIHKPTGIFAECQDERSQLKNKEKAMQALVEKITQKQQEKEDKNIKNQRNGLKNKIFSTTPEIVFDFDLNKVIFTASKEEYKLKDILKGNLDLIINNQVK